MKGKGGEREGGRHSFVVLAEGGGRVNAVQEAAREPVINTGRGGGGGGGPKLWVCAREGNY